MIKPRQSRSLETHNKILKAAIQCIAEVGYANTSTQMIAKKAGVSKGGIFARFPNKVALFTELTVSIESNARNQAFFKITSEFLQKTVIERAHWFVIQYYEFCKTKEGRALNEIWSALELNADLRHSLREHLEFNMSIGDLHNVFPECAKSNEIKFLSQMLYACVDMIATNERLVGNKDIEFQLEYLARRLETDINLLKKNCN